MGSHEPTATNLSALSERTFGLLTQCLVDSRGFERRPVVRDGVGEQNQVTRDAIVIADVVPKEALGMEAERAKHGNGALLVSHHLH